MTDQVVELLTPDGDSPYADWFASLDPVAAAHTIVPLAVVLHRYEEHIAGRTYFIEVSPVSASRWRAQIERRPGMPTSLMPFYGHTPEEAARELSNWLILVSGTAPTKPHG